MKLHWTTWLLLLGTAIYTIGLTGAIVTLTGFSLGPEYEHAGVTQGEWTQIVAAQMSIEVVQRLPALLGLFGLAAIVEALARIARSLTRASVLGAPTE